MSSIKQRYMYLKGYLRAIAECEAHMTLPNINSMAEHIEGLRREYREIERELIKRKFGR